MYRVHRNFVFALISSLVTLSVPVAAMAHCGEDNDQANYGNFQRRHAYLERMRMQQLNNARAQAYGNLYGNIYSNPYSNSYSNAYSNPYSNDLYYSNNLYGQSYGNYPQYSTSVSAQPLFGSSYFGNTAPVMNASNLLGLTPDQERQYIKSSKKQIDNLLDRGAISSQDARLLKDQLRAADNYYQAQNGGNSYWRSMGTPYNWNNPLLAFANNGSLYNGYTPNTNSNYGSVLNRLRSYFGI